MARALHTRRFLSTLSLGRISKGTNLGIAADHPSLSHAYDLPGSKDISVTLDRIALPSSGLSLHASAAPGHVSSTSTRVKLHMRTAEDQNMRKESMNTLRAEGNLKRTHLDSNKVPEIYTIAAVPN